MTPPRSILRSLGLAIVVIVVVVIYAYGVEVTGVDFETTRQESRLTQLTRILRALAHPDLIEYEQQEQIVEVPLYLPCPDGGAPDSQPDTSGPFIVVTPGCASARQIVRIEGFNLWEEAGGPVNFVPPSGASLTMGFFQTDAEGSFSIRTELPNRQPLDEPQTIRAIARRNIGAPYFSDLAIATKDKILETVFLALLATTVGTALAVPISFIAARNLMRDVKSPLSSVALSIIGWPVGFWIGGLAAGQLGQLGETVSGASTVARLGSMAISPVVIWGVFSSTLPREGSDQARLISRIIRGLGFAVIAAIALLFLHLLSDAAIDLGDTLVEPLGSFGFLGNFVFQLGDSLRMIIPAIGALVGGGAIGGLTGRLGQRMSDRMPAGAVKAISFPMAAIAGALLFAIVGAGIDWFYQFEDPRRTLWIPAGVGALLGIALAARARPKAVLPLGLSVYYVTRTILNATRSVEPLIMVIVFVVWVGIGPFAGALALGLHTVAALAKLFSEQVESILPGPLEAVRATGANRLQTIVYAVIPQIVPPYISFTMYRWDINVRMSTIIGFAGGGGIGFLLQQNIRLLDYRAASTQMLAIAIVVASMDYVSSTLRERFV